MGQKGSEIGFFPEFHVILVRIPNQAIVECNEQRVLHLDPLYFEPFLHNSEGDGGGNDGTAMDVVVQLPSTFEATLQYNN